jgi:hypothetical protein
MLHFVFGILFLVLVVVQGERITASYLEEACMAEIETFLAGFNSYCKAAVKEENIIYSTQLELDPGLDFSNLDDWVIREYYLKNTDFFALGAMLIVNQQGFYDFSDYHHHFTRN